VLTRAPGFTLVAALTLSLGIGGTSSVFSLFRAVFLNPLPFPEPDRLVTIAERRGGSRNANIPISAHEFGAWRRENQTLERIALHRPDRLTLTGSGEPERIDVVRASTDFFSVFGLSASQGRTFAPGEDESGGARVAILSDGFWRRRFGSDPAIVGREITVNDRVYSVIGVLPPLPESLSADAWLPLDLPSELRAVGRHNLGAVARLKARVTVAQAQSDLQLISERLAKTLPDVNTDHNAHVEGLREALVGEFRPALMVLLGAVGFVLLIACANLANLLLTRGAGRQREMAIRTAIGAGRWRLVRQLLVEAVLLSLAGGLGGVLIASWIVDLLPAIVSVEIPLLETARIDAQVVSAAAVLSFMTGIAIGLAPAFRASRADINRSLIVGHGISDDRGGSRLRSLLVASEVASTLMLLVGAGLMLNSFVRLLRVDPGFETDRVLAATLDLPPARYGDAERRRAFYDDLIERLHTLPGVTAVGAISHLPLGGADNWMPFAIEGRPTPPPGQEAYAAFRVATPEYFRTLGIPVRAGRVFNDADRRLALPLVRWFPQQPLPPHADRPQPAPVAVVSEAAARQFWPNENPIGKQIRVLFSPQVTIVGIVGDVHHNALNLPAYPHVYLAHNQEPWGALSVVVETSVPTDEVAAAVRDQIRSMDSALPVAVRAMTDVRAGATTNQRFFLLLVMLFGIVAIGLAVVGISGVVSYSAAQRRNEIGVRLALGAMPREILTLIVAQALPAILAGITAGLAGAVMLSGLMKNLLFGVTPEDPLTYASVAILLVAIALAACWIPARRASRLDPMRALRMH
jgi:putative ABC transport system permease protein